MAVGRHGLTIAQWESREGKKGQKGVPVLAR